MVIKRVINTENLAFKLLLSVAVVLFASIFMWANFSNRFQEKSLLEKAISDTDKFCNTVLNFTWFAMLHNPNQDMRDVLSSMSEYNEIETLRIFNRSGQIKFSNNPDEIGKTLDKSDVSCLTCHQDQEPEIKHDLSSRIRIFNTESGEKRLGIINPVLNKPDCSNSNCHYHPEDVLKLGTFDVVVSLENIDNEISTNKKVFAWTSIYLFIVLSLTIFVMVMRFVSQPIRGLIRGTTLIAEGDYRSTITVNQKDEIGSLADAINVMGQKISEKQQELNRQKDKYRDLFDHVPCYITVQNRDYRLLEYNQEFSDNFDPGPGDYCYSAYKGFTDKCRNCPVEKTFNEGRSVYSEEKGVNKDGTTQYWYVKTAPLKDENGTVVAAMEMSIDITHRKILEERMIKSEKKYQAIFKNIPNPVFILGAESHHIIDCNESALSVYGYTWNELNKKPFNMLFPENDMRSVFDNPEDQTSFHERVSHINKKKENLFVNIWVTPAEFPDRKVLLVTIIDITSSVETEHQLIQAGKMATLGEMATGVAHELNQPLSVIKTASSFISKKIGNQEMIKPDILQTLSDEIETHVDRAAKITNHMRLFSRKSVLSMENVNVNMILEKAFEIFSQQLKLREIDVFWDLYQDIPEIVADPVRLEQVFINLLINARDSIVSRYKEEKPGSESLKRISLTTNVKGACVLVKISDTGTGIADTHINKIFEPFFTTKETGKGTGLGLSISYGIIKECGGDIRVRNNREGGATFIINFKTGIRV